MNKYGKQLTEEDPSPDARRCLQAEDNTSLWHTDDGWEMLVGWVWWCKPVITALWEIKNCSHLPGYVRGRKTQNITYEGGGCTGSMTAWRDICSACWEASGRLQSEGDGEEGITQGGSRSKSRRCHTLLQNQISSELTHYEISLDSPLPEKWLSKSSQRRVFILQTIVQAGAYFLSIKSPCDGWIMFLFIYGLWMQTIS